MSGASELEELRRIRAQQRVEAEAAAKKEEEERLAKEKKAAFRAKATSFLQKKGPTDEEIKASVQKASLARKFDKQLSRQLSNPECKNPISTELNLRNRVNDVRPYGYDGTDAPPAPPKSDWEYVEQGATSYYWNRKTNESTYDMPYELQQQYDATAAPPAPPPPPSRHALPGLGQSSAAPSQEDASASAWQLVPRSQEEGGDYFWNSVTDESTYEVPPNWSGSGGTETAGAAAEWESCWDEANQCYYYLNLVTGASQWEAPPGMGEAETSYTEASAVEINQVVVDQPAAIQPPPPAAVQPPPPAVVDPPPPAAVQPPPPAAVDPPPPAVVDPPPPAVVQPPPPVVVDPPPPAVVDPPPPAAVQPPPPASEGVEPSGALSGRPSAPLPPRPSAPARPLSSTQEEESPDPAEDSDDAAEVEIEANLKNGAVSSDEEDEPDLRPSEAAVINRPKSAFIRVEIDATGDKSAEELSAMLEGVTFEEYINKFSNLNRKGVLKRRTSISKIVKWKHDLIKSPLLRLPSALEKDALQMFRNVTGFMGDRPSSKGEYDHVCKIISTVIRHFDVQPVGDKASLGDEVYVQICKQTNGNPKEASTVLGWELMMICLSCFPPSEDLKPHLMAYCASTAAVKPVNGADPRVSHYAETCLRNCQKSVERGCISVSEIPSEDSVTIIRQGCMP